MIHISKIDVRYKSPNYTLIERTDEAILIINTQEIDLYTLDISNMQVISEFETCKCKVNTLGFVHKEPNTVLGIPTVLAQINNQDGSVYGYEIIVDSEVSVIEKSKLLGNKKSKTLFTNAYIENNEIIPIGKILKLTLPYKKPVMLDYNTIEIGNLLFKMGANPTYTNRKKADKIGSKDEIFLLRLQGNRVDNWGVAINNLNKFSPDDIVPDSLYGFPVKHIEDLYAGLNLDYLKVQIPKAKLDNLEFSGMFYRSDIKTIDLSEVTFGQMISILTDCCSTDMLDSVNFVFTKEQYSELSQSLYRISRMVVGANRLALQDKSQLQSTLLKIKTFDLGPMHILI
jgi:hypothetical protein